MNRSVRGGLIVGALAAVVASGFGISVAATTSRPQGYKACSTSTGALGLRRSGACAKGSHKVTVSAQGPRGRVGPAGPFPKTLPEGKTETGAFLVQTAASSTAVTGLDQISFTFPLSADLPPSHTPDVTSTSSSGDPKHCTGSYDDPRAARGYLCLYLAESSYVASLELFQLDVESGASKAGAVVLDHPSTSSEASVASGSWAVTAP